MAQVYPVRAARPLLLLLFVLCSSLLFAQQPPTALKYPTPNVYRTNISTVALTPTVSGNVTTYSISPTLPAGLSFNTNTGAITGTPTASSAATTYTVTATNASGSTNTTLSIQVTNSYYNNANAQVSFLSANATQISGSNGGKTVGDRILYSGVATISGQTIDCIVTTSALTLGAGGTFDTYDQNATSGTNFNSNQPEFFAPQFNFGAAGSATFNFQFILGGSYNAGTNPSGTAVILQNVLSNVYDIDGNGGANSNQYVIAGDFNQYQLGSGTLLVPSLDASGRTRFRSSVNTNNGTVYADPTRVKMFHANLGNFSFTLGADGAGIAYYFVDFSVGQAFATAQTFTAPSIDLNTTATGVNNEAAACSAAMPFTNGASATNEATPSSNVFDSLVVSFSTADILDGANERILVNNATAGATLSLNADFGATTVTLGGISYTATAVTRSGVRFLKFTRANNTAANIEALLDALQYSNNATSANNGTRNFTVNAFTSNFASPDAIFSATVSCVSISGNVYHDANGLTDNTVGANGTPTTAANQVYAVLVSQSTGLAVKAGIGVAAGGAYSFGTVDPGNYFIYFRNAAVTSGTAISASTYPSGASGAYKSIGENIGAAAGSDGLVDGKIVVTLGSAAVTNANFGIELPPTTASSTLSNVANPGGYNYYTVPGTGGFTYADEDGTVQSITITALPAGANVIRLNGVNYTNGAPCPPQSSCTAFPVAGVVVPVANISAIAVDPTGAGTTSVVIPFRATDNGGLTDVNASANTVTINFIAPVSPITISGNVWDDVNGNGTKDVSEVFAAPANAGQTLYALLVQTSGTYSGAPTVYASTAVTAAAAGYSFTSVPSGNNYEVRLASLAAAPTDGVALSTITQSLPTGWTDVSYSNNGAINTGLNVTNPVITLGAVTASKPNVNFGVDALPAAVTGSATSVVNPGGANNAVVPATSFSGTDAVDLAGGSVSYVRLTAFPANATSITVTGALTAGGAVTTTTYTSGTFPAAGLYIATGANGNLSNANAVQVDPVNGAAPVALSYKVVDAAGIESANTATATVSFTDLVVSGSVYNDVNGGTINGTLLSSAGGALYVNLVNSATNTVVASKAVSGGTYSFNTADGLQNNITTYALVLTNAAAATGSTLPSTAWTYTAEGVSGTTGDGAPNGTYAFGASVTASTVIDFGVDALPATTALTTAATQQNPGGTNTVTVPATTFSGTDADAANGGIVSYVHITDFPANATTITLIGSATIGGPVTTTTYTSATFPAGGVYIATTANGNLSNAAAVKVDPVNGAVNVDISYRVVDNAGKESLASGAARQPLSDFSISGSVYDDPDAGIINGTLRSNAGGQLYVNLVSGTTLVASRAVSAAGTYSFSTADGLQNNVGDYSLVLTNTAQATTSTLPSAAFTYTAEGVTGTTGDGVANGTFTFGATVTANTVIDFGIDALPTVTALNTATSQVNPGGTATLTVPATTFSGADAGDLSGGLVGYILLTAFPTNATSITVTGASTLGGPVTTATYNAGNFPGGGLYIATNGAGNPSTTISVDPADGAVNVDFSYRTIDNAGKASTATGTARQPLSDLTVSGTVYDDADGNTDALIDGTPISNANGQLFVNLVNTATNAVVATRSLSNGTYSFSTADGLRNDISTYALVLTDAAGNTVAALSNNWVNTGEGLSGTSGDANANGRFLFGANVTTNKVVDFGIDALPAPAALTTAAPQVNPGGTATVTLPATTFSGTDASDLSGGRINYIHILSFPANATTVTFAAAATTPGGATANATYTTANFPVGGVYLASNAAGNPSSAIMVDPANGAVNVDFTYKVVDNANQESTASGIARQPLTDLTIAGTVYDDVTGGTIDGTPIYNAGGPLYVNLVNTATNAVVASQQLTDGTFSFGTADGLRNDIGTYRLVLTNSASATASALPSTAWVYMAEGTGGTGGDGLANGTFDFGGNVGTSRTIDFAIEALPVPAALTTATPQVNPGGSNTITVPASTFVASDAADLSGGAISYIHITALPTNVTSVTLTGSSSPGGPVSTVTYGAGFTAFPAGGVYLATNASGNPTQAITVDPVNGAVNVDFSFTAIDNSGKESLTSGIARQPLTDLTISGTIYDDVNGTKDGIINGTPVGSLSSTQLYVSLVGGGNVVATQAVAGNGTYSFSSASGVQTGTTYSTVLSTTAGTNGQPAPAAALPSGWVNTAEGTTAAGDGDHNGQASTGVLGGNTTVNFGVNALPVATSSAITALANPSGNTLVTIPSASFPGTDPEVNNTGEISFVHLTSFPSNVTSVYAYSSTSASGPFAFATYTSFPAGGIYLPTSLPGYLLPVDALQIDPVDNALNAQFNYTIIDTAGYESNGAVTTVPFTLGAISGTVYNDFNALLDGLINGVGTNLGNQLYVNAVSGTTVAASAQVASDGTYVLAGLTTGTYTLTLTTSAAGNSAALPGGWNHTGEGVSATQPSGDGSPNGLLTVTIGSDGLAGANFGIDARPIANSATAPTKVNPGGSNTITIPATSFSGSDPDAANGGEIQYVRLMTFPTNVTSISVTGALTPGAAVTTTTYTSSDFPAGGIYFATEDNGNLSNANALQVDPVNGSNSIGIQFKVVDNAGQQSLAIATLTQPLSDLLLTGTVYDDVNGGTINGTPVFNAGGPLFVNLVDTVTNTVVASQQLTDGNFSFSTANGLQSNVGSYQLILAKSATATVAALPSAAWVYLAEGVTGSTGDGNANGAFAFGGNVATSQVIDFAIDARPTASNNSAVTQLNPGGSNSVVVPAGTFSGLDAGDLAGGAISYVHLTTFPSNAASITVTGAATPGGAVTTTTYTSADFPNNGLYIATAANGNLLDANAVQVDPLDGAVTVGITYQVVDNSGVESTTPATASQPFSDLLISGTVYDDADGNTDALIDGTPISNAGGQLYVNLVNAQTGTVVASKLLTDGAYSFGTADGLETGVSTYQVVLANSASALAPALPNASAWVNTGEGLTATAGDGFPNGRYQVGAISASRTVDFGIDARPVPAILTTAPTQVNPGATFTVTIPATTFTASDATDISGGLVTYIRINAFPTNAATINFAAAATTLGGATSALSYNSGNFPAAGVYVATNGSGNPANAITVDPVDGAVNVDITFRAIDNANQESTTMGTARQPLGDLLLTGNVYDDVDGGLIDGARISTAGGALYVNLVDTATNTVVASQQLANGTFSFGTGNGLRTDVTTYKLVLTKTATLTTPALPSAAWVNLAEGLSGTTGDGLGDGGYALGGAVAGNTAVDFGIDARPVAVPLTVATPKVNPGGALFIGIANNLPLASDPVDVAGGQVTRLHVLTLPTNVDAIKVTASETPNGALAFTTYTAATFPAGGIYVATNASGSTLDSFFIDPINGTVTVEIQFRSIDQAGVESANIGLGQIPVGDLTISGNVYNDVNGNTDGLVNGTLISNAGGQLYVNLVDGTNTVISSKAVTGGAFSFGTADGLRNDDATYRVILAASPAATTQGLPNATEWVNTGEGPTGAPDGLPNGRYTLSVAATAPLTIDFGIDARPMANTLITASGQLNPGGTTSVTIPASTFAGTDADAANGGVISYLHLTSFPTNATSITFASAATTVDGTYGAVSYTAATFPAGGVYVATNTAGNPTSAIQVDPVDGAVTVDISYRTIDNASVESNNTGIARQPFTALLVSGNLYDDYNGLTDALLNGTGTSAGNMLYVNAVSGGNVVASAQVQADGTWSIDELTPGSYSLVLSTAPGSSTAAVPAGWVIMGEGTGTGSDGAVNGSTPLTLIAANVTNINFTIERYATADDKIYSLGPNTNPNIEHTTIANTANPAQSYAARINLSGASSSGSTPGALTGLDADGNNGSALTLTAGTPNVSVLIDPASYSGLRYGQTFVDAVVVQYAGIQLQPGGCQAGDIGNGACSLYNNATGLWEIPAYDLSQLKVLVRNGAGSVSFNYAWKDAAGAAGTFATYSIGFEQNLPVHLITFTGEKRGSNAVLNWKSVNESNFRGYGVERSLDGRSFTQVGFVNGRNLSSEQLYSYTDNLGSLPAGRVYYRLKQLDINGSFTYSPVVTLSLGSQGIDPGVTLLSNPVKNQLRLQVRTATAAKASLYLADGNGRIVFRQECELPAGTTALSFDIPSFLAGGIYHLVTQFDGVQYHNKVLVDR